MNRRTLFERSELGRPPQARVRPILNETGRGVAGFGSFCRNKRTSAAGPKPGNYLGRHRQSVTESHPLLFVIYGLPRMPPPVVVTAVPFPSSSRLLLPWN